MLHIYNSLHRQKQAFVAIEAGKVSIYVCGMTVYDLCHLGHARVLIVFDMVVRYFRSQGYAVNYVRNITDIDDKIIARASENNEDYLALTERFIDAMHEDEAILNVLPPDQEPRATAHIDGILKMIQTLEEKGFAYQGQDSQGNKGDVYYRVRQFSDYGKLSGKDVDDLRIGARVAEDTDKEDPLDFVLWKSAKPGEPCWDSKWGRGRPGWHIECSAMSTHCLADHFDIHAGGMDLQFPHHENEIAQSEAATGRTFANLWMHNGFVQINKEKMAKSLGNFFTIREILAQDKNPARMGEVIRYMVLASHYRSPLNYSGEALENARAALNRIYKLVARLQNQAGNQFSDLPIKDDQIKDSNAAALVFKQAMDDDFNTPEALSVLFDLIRVINKHLDLDDNDLADNNAPPSVIDAVAAFNYICQTLGIAYQDADHFLGNMTAESIDDANTDAIIAGELSAGDIQALIDERQAAKQAKQWARADEIREQLRALNIVIEDKPDGHSIWSFKG